MGICLVFYFILQLPWLIRAASSDCNERCGRVRIWYPFGIRTGCYHNSWFRVTCNQTTNGPKPFISRINLEILDSSEDSHTVSVNNPVIYLDCDNKGNNGTTSPANVNLQGSPFFSSSLNRFGSVGCDYLAAVFRNNLTDPIASCLQKRCSGQTSEFSGCYSLISENLTSYTASAAKVINPGRKRCTSAFITYIDFLMSWSKDVSTADTVNFSDISIDTTHVPAVLEWNPCDLEAAQCIEGTLPYLQSGCVRRCGNFDIPYPFGIEVGCYLNEWFRVTCNETIDGPKLYMSSINLQLLNVSVLQGTATINNPITYFNCRKEDGDTDGVSINLKGAPFLFSTEYNIFMSVGCGSLTTFSYSLTDEYPIRACLQPICANFATSNVNCTTDVPFDLSSFAVKMKGIYPSNGSRRSCRSAFIVDHRYLDSLKTINSNSNDTWTVTHVPATLQWATPKRGLCKLKDGLNDFCSEDREYCWTSLSLSYLCVFTWGYNGNINFATDICKESGEDCAIVLHNHHVLMDMNTQMKRICASHPI
ncbi:hypothetical protein J1N35_013163 [Gossypium stocksii]|uniref:Wall-associated receptor kinase galacturonan-binding domain-containing protein n=1 Tax=Gossypium stocksii TaxID=47602 RepID=A0A9D3VRZ5_9ROSI|nr:hypothetical protein J1N35_013163 [Gossypium stocksii]